MQQSPILSMNSKASHLKIFISNKNTQQFFSYLSLFVALCFLATGGIFVKLSELQPITTGFYRVLFAIPILFFSSILKTKQQKKNDLVKNKIDLGLALLAGVFLGLDLAFWNVSFHYTTVANANLLANMVPIIVVPISYFFLNSKFKKGFLMGATLALFGVIVLMSGKISPNPENYKGDAFALITAVFYGLYLILIGRLRARHNTAELMLWSSIGSLITLLPIALILESTFLPKTIYGLSILVALGVVSHVLGQGLLAFAMGHIKSSLSSVFVLLQPIIAGIYAWLIFKESLSSIEVLGMCVSLIGIYIAKKNS